MVMMMLSVSSSLDHLTDSWIMDSPCSYHMTPNKDCFDTYRLVNSGYVLMGNDASYRVFEIGNIRVKIFDGVIRALCDVRHIPYLRKNLISLGTLDSNGFNYKSSNGVMKVRKGVLTVMKGQKLARNFYKLMGTTILGGAETIDLELDSTTLWHMQLGHIGEHEIIMLHKRKILKGIKTYKLEL